MNPAPFSTQSAEAPADYNEVIRFGGAVKLLSVQWLKEEVSVRLGERVCIPACLPVMMAIECKNFT